MPTIGDIRQGKRIGKGNCNYYIWIACESCGYERWSTYRQGNPPKLCLKCQWLSARQKGLETREIYGEDNPNWKGGRRTRTDGYIEARIKSDDFFYPMADKTSYVLEHRLVMAKYLKRCLLTWEVVHHRNGIKGDNRIENLELVTSNSKHHTITMLTKYIKRLEKRIQVLEGKLNVKGNKV